MTQQLPSLQMYLPFEFRVGYTGVPKPEFLSAKVFASPQKVFHDKLDAIVGQALAAEEASLAIIQGEVGIRFEYGVFDPIDGECLVKIKLFVSVSEAAILSDAQKRERICGRLFAIADVFNGAVSRLIDLVAGVQTKGGKFFTSHETKTSGLPIWFINIPEIGGKDANTVFSLAKEMVNFVKQQESFTVLRTQIRQPSNESLISIILFAALFRYDDSPHRKGQQARMRYDHGKELKKIPWRSQKNKSPVNRAFFMIENVVIVKR